jgi:hypothetical protein
VTAKAVPKSVLSKKGWIMENLFSAFYKFNSEYDSLKVFVVMLALGLLTILSQVFKDSLTDFFKELLNKKGTAIYIVSLVFIALGLISDLYASTAFVIFFTATAIYCFKEQTRDRVVFLVIQVCVFTSIFCMENFISSYLKKNLNNRAHAYYIHPFKPNDTEHLALLKSTWHFYCDYIAYAFDSDEILSASVYVLPDKLSEEEYTNCITSRKKDEIFKNPGKIPIDVVLKNTADYKSQTDDIVLTSKVFFLDHSGNETKKMLIQQKGSIEDLQYLAMRTSLEFLFFLRQVEALQLSETDEEKIKRRILKRFNDFIETKPERHMKIAPKLNSAIHAEKIADNQIREVIDSYRATFETRKYDQKIAAAILAMQTKIMVNQ